MTIDVEGMPNDFPGFGTPSAKKVVEKATH